MRAEREEDQDRALPTGPPSSIPVPFASAEPAFILRTSGRTHWRCTFFSFWSLTTFGSLLL